MKQMVVVIEDKLIGCGQLMSFPNSEAAIRSFKEISQGDNAIAKHIGDHRLKAIATYDSEKGVVEVMEARILIDGKDLAPKYTEISEEQKTSNVKNKPK